MTENFERYHCQMAMPGFGETGQRRLQNARVLIVGIGGLGCPAAQYLAAAGIGVIGLADDDLVSETNLHRQILFAPDDIGQYKVEVAQAKLQKQNPSIKIITYRSRVDTQTVMDLIAGYDLVLDGTDNFETKYLLNDACVLSKKPLVYGAIYRQEGQVAVLNVLLANGHYSPNYRDIFPEAEGSLIPNCGEGGVLPALAGMVGCMQAGEVIKYFTAAKDLLVGKLCLLNMLAGSIYQIELEKNASVKIANLPEVPELEEEVHFIEQEAINDIDFQLIDVRSPAEHAAFNIGGISIPIDDLSNQINKINLNRPVVCYCATGKRSLRAAEWLQKNLPAVRVYTLRNGIARRKN